MSGKRIAIGLILLFMAFVTINVLDSNRLYSVKVEDRVDASVEEVWHILASEYGNIHKYSEMVESVDIIDDMPVGLGCVRQCTLKDGGFMREEIAIWEVNKRFKIVIKDTSMPMVPGTNILFELEPIGESVKIQATGQYRVKYLGVLSPVIAKGKYRELITYLIQIVKDAT